MVAGLPGTRDRNLLVGPETSDDAGAYRLEGGPILLQTVDIITPIVDDPALFGEIAAANSLSDVYAMGGWPVTALNILGYPIKELPTEIGREILRGGAAKVAEAGAVVVGGHTLEDAELKFGLSVTGVVEEERMTPNSGARSGDLLVLTKPLGTGIVSTAFKKGKVDEHDAPYQAMVASMRELNRAACEAMRELGARGATDVTGFGLGGHALELALASNVSLELRLRDLPLLPDVVALARRGCLTGGGPKNATWWSARIDVPEAWLPIVFDPQTSGGLLISLGEAAAARLCERLPGARVIGRVLPPAEPRLRAID